MTSRTSRWSNRSRLIRGCALTALIAAHGVSESTLAQRYSVTVLRLPEGYLAGYPHSINNAGDLCVYAFGDQGERAAVLWRGNRVITLPELPHEGRPDASASDISEQGVVVGYSDGLLGVWQAVMWPDENTVVPLLDRQSGAYGINDNLVVIGDYAVGFLEFNAFLWEDGQWFSLYPPIEFGDSVNNHKQALGHTGNQSWVWDNGVFNALPGLNPGDYRVRASSINNHSRLAGGIMRTPESIVQPVIWTDLFIPREMAVVHPGLGGGIGQVNISGLALGASYNRSQTDYRPTLWAGNLAIELNDLIIDREARGWRVSTPWSINDVGQIGATVKSFGQQGWSVARLDPIDTGLTLWGMEPSRPGTRNVIQVNHATPGGRVSLLWGTQRGEPTTLPQCSGAMIDIVDPRLAATARAGADGRAFFNVFIPANVEGLYVLQSVDHETCEVSPPAWALLKPVN